MQPDIVRYSERREASATGLAATFCGTVSTNTLLWSTAPTFVLASGTGVNRGILGAGFIQNTNAPGVAPAAGAWFNWNNSATQGTLLSLLERGTYQIKLDGIQTAAAALIWAISLNADVTSIVGMLNTVAGVETSTGLMTTVAADTAPVNLVTTIYVSEAMAGAERLAVAANTVNTQGSLTGRATVRFHCSQAAGGLPLDAEILQAQVRASVRWLGDFRGA